MDKDRLDDLFPALRTNLIIDKGRMRPGRKPGHYCRDCTRREGERCQVLGEINETAISVCKDAGYQELPRLTDRPPVRHGRGTGEWADILEGK